ncbi:MAG: SurA N-terminal domain-containing protein [Gammaproteobacteria bacterium]
MLQTIRDKFTGVIAFLIIGAIGVTLVISFGGMNSGVVTGNFAAEVNGEEIPAVDYRRVVQNQLYRQQDMLQGDLTPELQEQIQRNVLEALIRSELVKQHVRDAGFRIEDERVMQQIRSQEVFQVGGEYSYESYVMVLGNQGISPDRFEQEQRAQMEVAQLQNGIVASAFFTPAEYRRYIQLLAEERRAAFVRFDPELLGKEVDVTQEQLQAFYESDSEAFMSEEAVSLEYVEVLLEDVRQGVVVTDADVRDFYDANADRFIASDQRNISHILIVVDDEVDEAAAAATIEELRSRLDRGEAFESLAREYSKDPVSAAAGGDLGWAAPGDYPGAFEEALFELEPGQVSGPVRTEFGFHLIRLDELRAGEQQTLEDVRDELFDELRSREATDAFYRLAERVDDLALENPGNLAAVAAETGLAFREIDNFTRGGAAPLGYSPELIDAAFGAAVLDDGENSPLIELGDDRAVVISVTDYRPAARRPFPEVREAVEERLRLELGSQLALQRGKAALTRLRNGETLAALAEELGFDAPEAVTLNRGSSDVSPEILAAIFRAGRPTGERPAYHGLNLLDGGFAIFGLESVTPGRPEMIPQQQRDQRKQALAQQTGGNAVGALIADLRAAAKVYVAPGLFDQAEAL